MDYDHQRSMEAEDDEEHNCEKDDTDDMDTVVIVIDVSAGGA